MSYCYLVPCTTTSFPPLSIPIPLSISRTPNTRRIILGKVRSGLSAMNSLSKIILGSSSLARRRILAEMGYEFTVVTADIDEKLVRREKPEDLVLAIAHAKADAIESRLRVSGYQEREGETTLLITADTVVVYKGEVREKPSSKDEARKFITDYSNSHASVVGSVLVTNMKTGSRKEGWDKAEVYLRHIPEDVIDNLIEDGITLKVSGGLMYEHPLTLPFIESVEGSTDCVMGLPKLLTEKLIKDSL